MSNVRAQHYTVILSNRLGLPYTAVVGGLIIVETLFSLNTYSEEYKSSFYVFYKEYPLPQTSISSESILIFVCIILVELPAGKPCVRPITYLGPCNVRRHLMVHGGERLDNLASSQVHTA